MLSKLATTPQPQPHRNEQELDTTTFACPGCGAANETEVDPSAGRRQEYVQDCQVCCIPILLRVQFDGEGSAHLAARAE
ncbi:MAG: CPXCG motif-containing cysteine-rich protein [Planctomycetota bacterium]|jgi:transcription elongation factor Elf1